jgi:hypothetical protein
MLQYRTFMPDETRNHLVTTYGGLHTSGDPKPVWCSTYRQAADEVKRRLGVRNLHRRARGRRTSFRLDERERVHEGIQWRCEFAEDFSAVPKSHPDYARSGGHTLYSLVRCDTDVTTSN